jgi:hypothetical protein
LLARAAQLRTKSAKGTICCRSARLGSPPSPDGDAGVDISRVKSLNQVFGRLEAKYREEIKHEREASMIVVISDALEPHADQGARRTMRVSAACDDRRGAHLKPSNELATLKKYLGRHAHQDLPDRLEMGAACLNLL